MPSHDGPGIAAIGTVLDGSPVAGGVRGFRVETFVVVLGERGFRVHHLSDLGRAYQRRRPPGRLFAAVQRAQSGVRVAPGRARAVPGRTEVRLRSYSVGPRTHGKRAKITHASAVFRRVRTVFRSHRLRVRIAHARHGDDRRRGRQVQRYRFLHVFEHLSVCRPLFVRRRRPGKFHARRVDGRRLLDHQCWNG